MQDIRCRAWLASPARTRLLFSECLTRTSPLLREDSCQLSESSKPTQPGPAQLQSAELSPCTDNFPRTADENARMGSHASSSALIQSSLHVRKTRFNILCQQGVRAHAASGLGCSGLLQMGSDGVSESSAAARPESSAGSCGRDVCRMLASLRRQWPVTGQSHDESCLATTGTTP